MMVTPWHQRIYALYKGEVFMTEGTIREISRNTGKSVDFLRWMTYPTYAKRCGDSPKRLRLISLGEEE